MIGNNVNFFTIKLGKDKQKTSIKKITNIIIDIFFNAGFRTNLSDYKKVKLIRVPKFSEIPYPTIMEPNLVIEYYSR